jgi:cardiolipin synthase
MIAFLILILAIFLWITLDLKFGRKRHIKRTEQYIFPKRNAKWQLFDNGEDLYESLYDDIRQAKDHVHVLFYIIRNDDVSTNFLKLLKDKAKEGVTVRLLLDRFGGNSLPKKEIQSLKQTGVDFCYSNVPKLPFLFYTMNYRNHRKITVIDGVIGYFGGFNIGKEYLGYDKKLGSWRDFHLKLIGDGVQDLQHEFLADWSRATKKEGDMRDSYFPPLPKGSAPLQFVPTRGLFIRDFLVNLIHQARERIVIGTPYYVPGQDANRAIIDARKRGVEVIIVVPKKSDHALVKEAAFPYFKPLIEAGCSIYQYTNGFYHGKMLLIDNKLCDFGTANFDQRSFFINDELNCLIYDPAFIEKVTGDLERDMHHAELLTLERFNNRPMLQRGKEVASSWIGNFL